MDRHADGPGAGTYTIGLRATDVDGASVTTTRTVTVGTRAPVASFTASDEVPDVGEVVTLTSTSTDPDGDALASSAWDLDDDGQFDDAVGPTATSLLPDDRRPVGRLEGP